MTILVIDQFSGITPYWLQNNPMRFEELIARHQANPDEKWGFTVPRVLDVDDTWKPEMGQTALRANKDGFVEIWKCKWDSSG